MTLDRFRQNQRPTVYQLNKIIDMILANRILDSSGGIVVDGGPAGKTIGRQTSPIPESILCMVTDGGPTGEDDYEDDERYWVREMAFINTKGDSREKLVIGTAAALDEDGNEVDGEGDGKSDSPILFGFWETATNMTEIMGHTHSLPVGTPVEVFPVYDSRLTNNLHWCFFGGAAIVSTRSGQIWKVTEVDGPPSAHTYQGVYTDVTAVAPWQTASRGDDGTIGWEVSELQSLGGNNATIIRIPLEVGDYVDVIHYLTDISDSDAGEEELYVSNPAGLGLSEAPEFMVC